MVLSLSRKGAGVLRTVVDNTLAIIVGKGTVSGAGDGDGYVQLLEGMSEGKKLQ